MNECRRRHFRSSRTYERAVEIGQLGLALSFGFLDEFGIGVKEDWQATGLRKST